MKPISVTCIQWMGGIDIFIFGLMIDGLLKYDQTVLN